MAERRALVGRRLRAVASLVVVWLAVVAAGAGASPSGGVAAPAVADLAISAISPRPENPASWLALVNWWRSFGGSVTGSPFPTVTNQAADNVGPQNHVDYLASIWAKGSTYCGHGEDPAYPKNPSVNYGHNVLFCNVGSIFEAVDGWDNTPYHAPPILAPTVTRVGAGFASFGDRTAAAAGTAASAAIATTYTWPRDAGVLPRSSMRTGESPDPTALCPPETGQRPGQPLFAWFPESRVYVSATLQDGAGPLPFCILSNPFASAAVAPGDARSSYAVFSKRPYTIGSTVTASLTTRRADGSDQRTTTWTFDVVDTPAGGLGSFSAVPGGIVVTPSAADPTQSGGLPILERALWVWPRVVPVPKAHTSYPVSGTGSTTVAMPAGSYWVCVASKNAVGWSQCGTRWGVTVVAATTTTAPATTAAATTTTLTATTTTKPASTTTPTATTTTTPTATTAAATSSTAAQATSTTTGGSPTTATTPTVPIGATTDAYVPMQPARLLDTRPGGSTIDGLFAGSGTRPAGSEIEVAIAGRAAVPFTAAAVMLNVTATEPAGTGFITVHPCGTRPNASNLNVTAGRTIPNAVLATLSPRGTICIYTDVATQLLVDVSGYFPAGSGYRALTPARLLDTRPGGTTTDTAYAGIGFRAAGSTTEVQVTGRGSVPADATAAMLNVTATGPSSDGYVTVHPCGTVPNASNLNVTAGQTIPNAVLASLSPRGTVCLTTSVGTHLLIDVSGSFAAGAGYQPLLPARLFDSRPGGSTTDGRFRAGGVRPAGSTTVVEITGRGGVPAGATAVMLNVTATEAGGDGYLTVYPCGTRPNASNLNVLTGDTIPNAVLATLATNGTICVYTDIATHLLIDVNGAFTG